ncbi:Uncharacterized protein OBRU01_16642 [Operophtera brumata]|uniref:Uncharacterized protein n=1 Tax=Operophtera brumata TaxID=104452 RepID=A0A0L7KW96_OPEBR|nr:Uncharacterized protein OBRU01_16642 [Operophtera brumata]
MAQKALEIAVRDLQKVIGELVNKIGILESKIDDQCVLIKNQEQVMSSLRTIVEGRPDPIPVNLTPLPPIADAQAPPALQRPVRQARLNADAKLVSSRAAAANNKPAAELQRASIKSTPTAPETSRTGTKPAVPQNIEGNKEGSKPSRANETTTSPSDPGQVDTATIHSGDKQIKDQDQWHVVSRGRRKNPQRPITVGTGRENNDLQAAERVKYIQAWSFRPDTTTEKVLDFLKALKQSEYTVEKRHIKSDTYASFLIGMPESVYDEVTTPTAWPPRVCFVPWFPARPRREWGSERADSGA